MTKSIESNKGEELFKKNRYKNKVIYNVYSTVEYSIVEQVSFYHPTTLHHTTPPTHPHTHTHSHIHTHTNTPTDTITHTHALTHTHTHTH
jgi:hypothetical protein